MERSEFRVLTLFMGIDYEGAETSAKYKTGVIKTKQKKKKPFFTVRLGVRRRHGYWVTIVMTPITILAAVGSLSFVVPDKDVRVNLLVTMLLCVIAFKFSLSESLPRLPYMTIFVRGHGP